MARDKTGASFLSQSPLDLPKELVMDVNKAPFCDQRAG